MVLLGRRISGREGCTHQVPRQSKVLICKLQTGGSRVWDEIPIPVPMKSFSTVKVNIFVTNNELKMSDIFQT